MKVSICCPTYNHEKFIAAALDGFLMQQTTFDFEIIIGDDHSTDSTPQILLSYKEKYPDKIKLLLNEKNIGTRPNFINTINISSGKYIAVCDGDDYWIDDTKLQQQVDFLEAHEDYAISSHNSMILDKKNNLSLFSKNKEQKSTHLTFHLVDYLKNHFIHSSSVMFRKSMLKPLPAWYTNAFAGDGFLILLLALEGKIHYINKPMSVYRYNSNSISKAFSRIEINKDFIKHFKIFDEHSGYKYSKEINEKIFSLSFNLNYYNPSYLKKLGFFTKHFFKIISTDKNILPLWGRYKFLLPLHILKSRINITEKKLHTAS